MTTTENTTTTLAETYRGATLVQTDDGYRDACAGWNLAWQQQPAVVVRAEDVADVVTAVRHASAAGLGVAVQNTGHGVTVAADDRSLLIVTRNLDGVRVDPDARTATVAGGTTWQQVLPAAQQHGLAPLMGSAPHIGTVGYALGGGFGWLARPHGLAVDNIRSLVVVTADGDVVTTSPTQEPELFWALCGTAGSALGVVVEMTIALAPVSDVHAGNLFYPLDAAGEAFDRYLDWSARAPRELTSAFNLTSFPPLELVPEPLRAKTFVIVRGCHAGPPEAAEALVDEFRAWRQPLMDTWGTMPFARSPEISMDPVDPVPAASSGRWLQSLDHSVLDAMLEAVIGGGQPSPMLFAEFRHGGGAIREDNPAVSYASRDGAGLLEFVGMITAPGADADLEQRFASTWERLAANLARLPGYLNFAEGREQVEISGQSFDDATRTRLAAAKRRYDPDNLFRHGIPLTDPA